MNNLFPLFYLGSIEYYSKLVEHGQIIFEQFENFPKQTYRNRCVIAGPNGKQNLLLPVLKGRTKQLVKDVRVSNTENWQKIHWKSLEAAYRSSPYFEYYENEFYPYYHTEFNSLQEFNLKLHETIIHLLQKNSSYSLSVRYEPVYGVDYRSFFSTKSQINNENLEEKKYIQVFSDRMDFLPNLSILDLLFNEGPNALAYLKLV